MNHKNAKQFNDTMFCDDCNHCWDVNDLHPPECVSPLTTWLADDYDGEDLFAMLEPCDSILLQNANGNYYNPSAQFMWMGGQARANLFTKEK